MTTGAITSLEDPPAVLAPPGRRFHDRREAGERLARLLEPLRSQRPIILAMPRGGVPVAAEVAKALHAPLDVVVVRKIGAPQNPEFAIGAVAEGGVRILSAQTARALDLSGQDVERLAAKAQAELALQTRRYRGTRHAIALAGRTVVVVDDGLATGRSARAAIAAVRKRGAARVVLAVPVAAPASAQALLEDADEVVCVEMPDDLWAVGVWYEDFDPVSEEEVAELLVALGGSEPLEAGLGGSTQVSGGPISRVSGERLVQIDLSPGPVLEGDLVLSADAKGVVVFAHGSGSSRHSPRNRAVARAFVDAGYSVLLFDLLSPAEALERANVFDVGLLASRLVAATAWLDREPSTAGMALAYFGASTGAAAALTAAARLGDRVQAVVSRGGRPDLALDMPGVRSPTLLIVGGSDEQVLELNRVAQRQLHCPNELAVVPGATHLFEETGALELVSRLSIEWLDQHLHCAEPVDAL